MNGGTAKIELFFIFKSCLNAFHLSSGAFIILSGGAESMSWDVSGNFFDFFAFYEFSLIFSRTRADRNAIDSVSLVDPSEFYLDHQDSM